MWRRRADGTLVVLTYDEQHRPIGISYPAAGGFGPLPITVQYDEFSHPIAGTGPDGAWAAAWDLLNRLVSTTPPAPQKALAFAYTPDTSLQRWITTVTVSVIERPPRCQCRNRSATSPPSSPVCVG